MPLLIDGDSVRLGSKTFTPLEIGHLKTKNANNAETTYEIFQTLDNDTLSCAFTNSTMPTKL